MNIVVNPSLRLAEISAPAVFAMSERQVVTLAGLASPDLDTLRLALYGRDGTLLALCSAFAVVGSGWTGTLDTHTKEAVAAFAGLRPDERVPVIVALGDDNVLWFSTGAEMTNNPLRSPPTAPDPAPVFLTADRFAGLPMLSADSTSAERAALLNAIAERLMP